MYEAWKTGPETMPLYEYECTTCHKHTEKIQKFSDPEITVCPHCGGTLERVISAPAIAFKGGGWYADGYGNAKPKSSGDASAQNDAPAKTGTESTPAATPAPSTPTAAPAPAAPSPAPSSDKK